MNQFIKLSKLIINKNHIVKATIDQEKVRIYMNMPKQDGLIIFGSGTIDTYYDIIEIKREENVYDYKNVVGVLTT